MGLISAQVDADGAWADAAATRKMVNLINGLKFYLYRARKNMFITAVSS